MKPHPELALAIWPAIPPVDAHVTDPQGVRWRVEWRSEDGGSARLRAGGLVRGVTRERVADWRRE